MNVAIVGSSGYISSFLIERFAKEDFVDRIMKIDQTPEADEYLNLLNPEEFDYDKLKEIDFVVFTAAISGPDKCAEEYDWCWSINVTGTKYFIEKALERNCKVLFFSSDAVFGDIPGKIYNELSETEPQTPYGKMKKAIEDEFKDNNNFKAIRLSYVVSKKDRFVSYCLKCIETGEKAEVFHPFYRNCISVTDVVDVVVWMAKNWCKHSCFALNIAGKELVSRVRIADEIKRLPGMNLDYCIIRPDETFYKNRPEITQMESIYMSTLGIIEDNNFTQKIQKEMEK